MTEQVFISKGVMQKEGIVAFARAMKVTENNIDEVCLFAPDAIIIHGFVTEDLLNESNFGDEFCGHIGNECIVCIFDDKLTTVPLNCYLVKEVGKTFIGDTDVCLLRTKRSSISL